MKVGKKMLEGGKQRMNYALQKVKTIDLSVQKVNAVIKNLAACFNEFGSDITSSCEALFDR